MKRHSLPPEIEKEIVTVIEVIMQNHIGRARAIKRDALLGELLRAEPMLSDRQMRRIIADHLPHICGSPKVGYFLASTPAEARRVAETLEHYIRGLAKKRKAIIEKNPEAGQMSLGI